MSGRPSTIATSAAAVGLAAVLAAHSLGGTKAAIIISPTGSTRSGSTQPAPGSTTQPPTGSTTPGSTTPGSTTPGSTTPTSTTAPKTSASGTVTGALEQYGYGELSVTLSVSGGRITSAKIATIRTAEQYSQQLAQQVVPTLSQEVLSAQSARISSISGATYTSEAYAASVQSALDKLGL